MVERLIGLETVLVGPTGRTVARLILDTGAVMTTVVPRVAESIGYSSAHQLRRTVTRTAAAEERGYIVLCDVSTLGFRMRRHSVVVAELGYGIHGLLGLNFLQHFNLELRYAEQRVLVEPIAS